MKISEYIQRLEAVQAEIGDVEVMKQDFAGARITARCPTIGYTKILKGRERKDRFWTGFDDIKCKGKPVCRV